MIQNKSIFLFFIIFILAANNFTFAQSPPKNNNSAAKIKKDQTDKNKTKEDIKPKKKKKKSKQEKTPKDKNIDTVESKYFRPYIGFWFGVVSLFAGTTLTDYINGFLGGGLYFRLYFPYRNIQLEVSISYTHYNSKNTITLHLVPFYLAFIYTLPFKSIIKFHLKLGVAGAWGYLIPDNQHNTLPGFMFGMGLDFPAGDFVKIGVLLDYTFITDRHIPQPINREPYERLDGHLIHFGITVLFTWIK